MLFPFPAAWLGSWSSYAIEVCLNALGDISVFRLRVDSDGAEKFRTELVILLQRNQTLIAK